MTTHTTRRPPPCERPPVRVRRGERRRFALWARLLRPAAPGVRVPLLAERLLAALGALVERRSLGPLLRRARRERLARRGPEGGWPNRVTERTCVWLVRDGRVYRAVLEQAGNAILGTILLAKGDARGAPAGPTRERLAAFLREQVACHLRASADAARFVGCSALTSVDWSAVADWFLTHRVHPGDCNPD